VPKNKCKVFSQLADEFFLVIGKIFLAAIFIRKLIMDLSGCAKNATAKENSIFKIENKRFGRNYCVLPLYFDSGAINFP